MPNYSQHYKLTVLLLAILFFACEEDTPVPNATVCEDVALEIEFVVPDSFLAVEVINGTPPYTYQWSNGNTRRNLFSPDGGLNSVTVTDANGCTAVGEIELQTDCRVWVRRDLQESTEPNTYTLTMTATGENPPFAYRWSDGQTDNTIFIPGAGNYRVSISDANGCLIGSGITLNEGPDGLCELRARIRQEEDGRLRASVSRGSSNTSYSWSDGSTEREILNPVPGTLYSLTVTTEDGCPATAELQL